VGFQDLGAERRADLPNEKAMPNRVAIQRVPNISRPGLPPAAGKP
jgi:hypothetical protein